MILRKKLLVLLCFVLVFYGGFLQAAPIYVSIYDIQSTVDASGNSMYAGEVLTISGTVTAVFVDGYTVAEASGPWQAIFVYSKKNGPDIGDDVEVTGTVSENYGMTMVSNVTSFQHLSSGNNIDSTFVSVGEASQEQYESVLITVEDVSVTGLLNYGEWIVSDEISDILLCDDLNDYVYFPKLGDSLVSITGILFYSYGYFKIEPRTTNDIKGEAIPHYALHGHIVTMNETRDIIRNAYLEIIGDEIIAIRSSRPLDIPVVEVGGLIFPGLIDSHNHPAYNVLDLIPFQETFTERYEWQALPLYADFKNQYSDMLNYGGAYAQSINMIKLAEVRALTAGTTSIQGLNCNGNNYDGFAHQGIIVNNIERFPARVYSDVFPLRHELAFWAAKRAEYWDRFVIHLSEGTSFEALYEFLFLQSLGMLDARVSIIHGIPFGADQWSAMANVQANLIWSPVCSQLLYDYTADIPGALAAGVNVALAPDWTESGSYNILDELKVADYLNREIWGDAITPLQFAEFVTCNAAKAVGAEKIVGQIAPGFRANLMVIPGGPEKPYKALLKSEASDIKLTVVDGRPMYGDPNILAKFLLHPINL